MTLSLEPSRIAGVVLAGGLSRRMGGPEKSLMDLAGIPQMAHVIARFRPQVFRLAINANGDPNRFGNIDCDDVIADTVEGHVGPLAGVLSGMRWAADHGATHLATAATDTPFLPTDLVQRLAVQLATPADIAMASSGGRIHPVFAIWPVALADDLERFLVVEDKRKILEFAKRSPLREVEFSTEGGDPFFNINTPDDLADAQKRAETVS